MEKVSKALAGAIGGAVIGNGTLLAVPAEANMPWWGYIIANVIYLGAGFATVYFAPKNAA